MAEQWYVARGKEKLGPFSAAQLKALATQGRLLPTDMLHKEGLPKWVTASSAQGLFATTTATASLTPPATLSPQPLNKLKAPSSAPIAPVTKSGATAFADWMDWGKAGQHKPWYKRKWAWMGSGLFLLLIIASASQSGRPSGSSDRKDVKGTAGRDAQADLRKIWFKMKDYHRKTGQLPPPNEIPDGLAMVYNYGLYL